MGFFDRLFGKKTIELPPPPPPEPIALLAAPHVNGAPAPKKENDLVDDLLAAVDATFVEEAVSPLHGEAKAGLVDNGNANIEELFAEIASQYARPIKEMVIELRRGSATRDWIGIAKPAMQSIHKSARSMNMPKAIERMADFEKELDKLAQGREAQLTGTEQAKLLERYDRMVEVMPKTFAISEEMKQRDTIIIISLLKQIPEVGRVTFDKLYAAGLTSLDVLLIAKKDELAVATGIPMRIAEQICTKVQKYRDESSGTKRVDMNAYRKRLSDLTGALKKANDAYNNAENADEKRKARGSRSNLVFQISILLAELGEPALVKEIETMTFERRITALDELLARTAQRK
jgi:hypothetical protein